MKEVIDFFRRLHDNNDRAWFDAHRTEWAHVKGRFAAFTEQLIAGIAEFDPTVRASGWQTAPTASPATRGSVPTSRPIKHI